MNFSLVDYPSLQPRFSAVVFNLRKGHGNEVQGKGHGVTGSGTRQTPARIPTLLFARTLTLSRSTAVSFLLCEGMRIGDELHDATEQTHYITWGFMCFWRKCEAEKQERCFFSLPWMRVEGEEQGVQTEGTDSASPKDT